MRISILGNNWEVIMENVLDLLNLGVFLLSIVLSFVCIYVNIVYIIKLWRECKEKDKEDRT